MRYLLVHKCLNWQSMPNSWAYPHAYLTNTLEEQIFYPPEGEEWIATIITPQIKPTVEPCVVVDLLNPKNMLPYLSPAKLAPEEEREREQEYRNWGEYLSSSTNSMDQFHKTYEATKTKKRRKRPSLLNQPDTQLDSLLVAVQTESAMGTPLSLQPCRSIPSERRKATTNATEKSPIPIEEPVQLSTSKDVANIYVVSTSRTSDYVIPKLTGSMNWHLKSLRPPDIFFQNPGRNSSIPAPKH